MALSKNQIAQELEARGHGKRRQISNILDGLSEIAHEQIEQGEDFTVPGVAKIAYGYQPALKKGEKYKKGDTVVGFGGIESVKDADSPAKKASVRLRVSAATPIKRLVPSKNDTAAQSAFLKGRAGKNVVARKGNRG